MPLMRLKNGIGEEWNRGNRRNRGNKEYPISN